MFVFLQICSMGKMDCLLCCLMKSVWLNQKWKTSLEKFTFSTKKISSHQNILKAKNVSLSNILLETFLIRRYKITTKKCWFFWLIYLRVLSFKENFIEKNNSKLPNTIRDVLKKVTSNLPRPINHCSKLNTGNLVTAMKMEMDKLIKILDMNVCMVSFHILAPHLSLYWQIKLFNA